MQRRASLDLVPSAQSARPTREKDDAPSFDAPTPAPLADRADARFDVVVLVTSAGGLEALQAVLRELPADFPAAVIVGQHLGGQGSALVRILGRRTRLPVAWAAAGAHLAPGRVLVCPPRHQLEILPDGTCGLSAEISTRQRPLDTLLESIADSYGPRALAVVLTGMGKDAAAGAAAVRLAGGVVLVQSAETAEQPSMPQAAIERGAADLVLPLHDMAAIITDAVTGGELPRQRAELDAAAELFAGPGEVRRLLRVIDWSRTSLGPIQRWPVSLRTTLRLVLDSPMPMLVLWGPDPIKLYNDPYRVLIGVESPSALGQSHQVSTPELWEFNNPIHARVLAGEAVALTDTLYPIRRRGMPEDAWFDMSFAPVRGEDGAVAGVLTTLVETTARVLSRRRLRTLQALTDASAGAVNVRTAMQCALATLTHSSSGRNGVDEDVLFALGYLREEKSGRAQLIAATGVDAGGPMAPHTIDLGAGQPAWPLATVLGQDQDRSALLLDDLAARFRGILVGSAEQVPTSAILLPLCPIAAEPPTGVLVCGINPRLILDDAYRVFLDLVAARVSASLAEAHVRQAERERAERLTELDRVKTEFFSNISHEFRTPLTLLLAPLEELSRRTDQLPQGIGDEIRVATRNARRLLNQVNTLLDFSQVEAARLRAQFEPTDLAALTRDIASVFRSAAERAGLQFRVDCPPLLEPVWVDPQMWERVVSNLLSNALKFTFEGEIAVELSRRAMHAELIVRDTGVGIPADDLAHVFKRFHRVKGRRGRTNDGSGIGLALVHELVRLHQGRVRVRSTEDEGTTFTVWMPMGRRPRELAQGAPSASAPVPPVFTPEVAAALAEEAIGWVSNSHDPDASGDERVAPSGVAEEILEPAEPPLMRTGAAPRARVLVVDDNADMRDYMRRLLAGRWEVELASDGEAALATIRTAPPDVVIADVMMPGLDGFALLAQIRADPTVQHTPVVLVTARAGEQAALEGLRAGADDYIAKPFSARELLARIHATIERSRTEAELRDRAGWMRGQREALEAAVNDAPLETSLDALVRAATTAMGEGTRAAFYLTNSAGTSLHHVVGMSHAYAEAVNGFRVGPELLACGLATATGTPVLTMDVMAEAIWEPWRWLAERFDYRGCWTFPIHATAGNVIGTLALYIRQPRTATPRDLELAAVLTQTAAIIIARHAESAARKQAEDALNESTQRLTKMVALMPAAVYTCDGEGRLTFFNQRAAELWGREPRLDDDQEKFCGSIRMWTPGGALLRHADSPMAHVLRDGRPVRDREVVIERLTGSRLTANLNIDPLYDRAGQIIGAINVFADVSEAARRTAALRESRDDAVRELEHATHRQEGERPAG